MKKIIDVDMDKCLGCHTCEMECAIEHSNSKNLFSAIQEIPIPQYRMSVEFINGSNIPWQCRHCDYAPCETVCPTASIGRKNDEAPIVINKSKCIGCKMCIQVCPFGVLKISKADNTVIKCDFCIKRLEGEKEPACVKGCPTNALKLITLEELSNKKKEATKQRFLSAFKNDDD
ncbi:iron-sulfur protein [Clostridium pasteurianum DSM 525 = ATCC 6013]|uniref:4Fe-4S ferredoxin, iron-sulpur binding domain-containing protein n=1 Tax=Clostridium pasteurianum DSM 525 = ATCC 6013 TaxID=1262449 RepID=A0A0H3JBC7_CLOPA|nr:4Fe-4S dicluster domain-containing protein [Clostridium pasteurianum]AJA49500.1 iron-sulfur protein [Clostridium pasteurianum DSM 525 = ATCC 6013]AJA53488.1 iron-sulfur protein [Clostridium pasteurianum DSM 525 = ATCC 6013]AOZ76663.1 4Fe-4S ferredoxin [Clostridium pasteurianum DSM 525 = ATCC 6013]AOZ80460.1 4Fe-4S ferredoxin [Clostridium pasteurianum]ELP58980.1 4Fe-4S ferredoxin [Clostridium pasteurianum DSM 525 = ATCC 6013]